MNEKMNGNSGAYRRENDSIGCKEVPEDVYYGCLLYTSACDYQYKGNQDNGVKVEHFVEL